MNYNLEQFITILRQIRLSKEEDARMRSFLLEYTAHRPVRKLDRSVVVQWFAFHRFVGYVTALLVLAVISTGVAYAAEGTVPGDTLYEIKVAVTEPVRSVLARTVEEKASWEVARAERRLAEAETLAYEGKLTDTYRKRIEVQLEAHLEGARIRAQEREEVLTDIEETVEAVLEVHEGILTSLDEQDGDSVGGLLALVRERNTEHREARNLLTQATDTDEVVEDTMSMAALSQEGIGEETATSDMVATTTKEDLHDMSFQLEDARERFDAVTEEAHRALDVLPPSTQSALGRLLRGADDALNDAEGAYTDGRRKQFEEAITETVRSIRRIEAALRATVHIRRIDPELWPIDIAPQRIDEEFVSPLLKNERDDGEVRGEYREEIIENNDIKAERRLRDY